MSDYEGEQLMRLSSLVLVPVLVFGFCGQGEAQEKVADLEFHHLQNYCWMRLAEVVPEVTDRAILAIGTVEPHGAVALGADNIIPQHLAEMIWERTNALVVPPVNHGFTGDSISQFPGAITVRAKILEEYLYDVLDGLVKTGFRNILIINGHGGNTDPAKAAMTRLHQETGAHFMVVDWWEVAFEATSEVYGGKAQQSGHGDREEAALVMAADSKYVDREKYEELGKENVGSAGVSDGVTLLPAWATTRYPEEGVGFLDFDVDKANAYAAAKADFIADTFNEACRRWSMMESWKK
jgi:creatinine amidohydrolase